MGLSNIIRGIGNGISGAVRQGVHSLEDMAKPAPAETAGYTAPENTISTPAPATGDKTTDKGGSKGFTLPDLGPGPDQNAPEYQDEAGKKKYAADLEQYQHKQSIHQAFMDLDKIYTEAHPTRDFQKEYEDQIAQMKQHEKERPQGSGLARAALALGSFNPADNGSSLREYDEGVKSDQARSDKGFATRMALRAKMHESAAQEAETQGNWKKALAEQEKLALLKADQDALEHKNEMEKVNAQQTGANTRATIRRDAMENSARIRASAIGATHGLSGTFEAAFQKEAAKAVAKFLGPHDLTKEYSPYDLDSMTNYIEGLAEMFHDKQYGTEDGGTKHLNTHPGQRKPAPAGKEKF